MHLARNSYRLLFFVFILCTGNLFAQKTIVKGKVIDEESGESLPFVNLIFKDSKIGTTTDIDGNYYLETYYPTDSLLASFVGYDILAKKVKVDISQTIDFKLKTGDIKLKTVEIKYKGNPAHKILDRVKLNKKTNNREKYDYYKYEVYNKVEFDLNNITDDFRQRRMFKKFQFIFDYVDTTSEKAYLPMFMTESLSDFYYRRAPKSEKEYIKASKISGTSNQSITQFLGDMYQRVNVYDNYISVFDKSFVSPIADFGKTFYRYYLIDSVFIDNKYCYQINFIPRQKQEPVFEGTMWINDTTYAVKRIEATINENANINFINGFEVKQEYKMVDNQFWMLEKDELVVDFQIGEKVIGLYGRKSTSYKDFEINVPQAEEFYEGIDNVSVLKGANKKTEEFWNESRHDSLTQNQKDIYIMVDSVKKVPAFKTLIDFFQLVVTGYKEVGNFEFGPYFKAYSFNQVEGHRFRLGGRTSNKFSTRIMLNGYLAYGTKDQRFKYSGGFIYKLSEENRQWLEFQYKSDLEQLGQSQNAFAEDNILSSFFRRNPNNKLTDVESYNLSYKKEWITGFSNTLFLKRREMKPLGSLEYRRFDPDIGIFDDQGINTSEVSLYTRFAYKEKYVEGEFERISLGSRYPILELQLGFGIKDLIGGDYDYQKFEIAVSDDIKIGVFGYSDFRLTAGKYFGTLPYTILEIHNGNETFFLDDRAFNLMNFFEFVSDEYATVMLTHHFDGFFLNKIPFMRKLKWREIASFSMVAGGLNDKHRGELIIPQNTFSLDVPYMEVGIGVENILKLIRVDAIWRLNYLDHDNINKFGIATTFEFSF